MLCDGYTELMGSEAFTKIIGEVEQQNGAQKLNIIWHTNSLNRGGQ